MENHYHEYGIPLQIFHDKCPLFHHFGMRNVEEIATGKGFLGGTSNFLIKTLSKVGWDILIDLDNNSVQFKNDSIKKAVTTSKKEKELISGIIKKLDKKYPKDVSSWSKLDNTAFVEKNEEIEYEGSEEWIRQKFNDHLKEVLTEIEYFRCYASEAKLESTIQIYNAYLTKKGEETEGKGSIIKLNTKVDSEGDSDRKSFERLDSASPSPFKNIEQRTFFPTDQNKTESPKKMSEDSIGAEGVHKGSLDEFEEKKDSKDNLEVIQEENLNPDDPRVALKKELAPVKSGMKTLKDYGPEWITEWAKTDNFRCWARRPREMIRDRSVNNPSARDYLWLYENGDLYYGGLASGQKQGNGQYIYRNLGWIYRGAWAKDKRSGPATITSIKGTDYSFEGSFKNDKKDGPGKLINGKESYSGTFANDKYEGSGVLTDVYQNLYDGEFKDGYKWGMGKLKYANGETYIGEMLKDTLHGRGTYVYSSGHVYSGLFNSGRKTGQGILQSPTGDVSEGQFIEDEFCGRGTLRKADGHTFEGEFSKGELVNGKQGVIYYPDGSKYEGPIVNYKPHGEGKLTKQFEKIEIIKGRFENGELVEEFKEEAPKNQAREEEKKDENPAAPIETQADKKEIEEVVNEEKEIEKIKKEEEIIEKKEEESEQKSEQKEEAAGEEGEKEEAS